MSNDEDVDDRWGEDDGEEVSDNILDDDEDERDPSDLYKEWREREDERIERGDDEESSL